MLTTEHMKKLNLARYEFHLRASVDAVFPPFLGTALRGAFGHALKAIACSMPHGDCSRCFLVEKCLYPRLFETSAPDPRGRETREQGPSPLTARERTSAGGTPALPVIRGDSVINRVRVGESNVATPALPVIRGDSVINRVRVGESNVAAHALPVIRGDSVINRVRVGESNVATPALPVIRGDSVINRVRVGESNVATAALPAGGPTRNQAASALALSNRPSNGDERQPRSTSALLKSRQDAPRPFIFIPPFPAGDNGFMRARDDLLRWRVRVKAGEMVVFGLSLFGDTIQELPYVIYAISLMAQHGFGAERASFTLERVAAIDPAGNRTLIYTPDMTSIRTHLEDETTLGILVQARLAELALAAEQTTGESHLAPAAGSSTVLPFRNPKSEIQNSLTLRFLTPTRLRIKGRVVEHPTFNQLVSSISLRLSMLAETWGGAPLVYDYKGMIDRAREVSTRESSLRLMALDRFSNRRHGKLELDGFMGEVTFDGPVGPGLLLLLIAGEFLHIGSGTAFGLGRYVIR